MASMIKLSYKGSSEKFAVKKTAINEIHPNGKGAFVWLSGRYQGAIEVNENFHDLYRQVNGK
jgi:hypothetical protein